MESRCQLPQQQRGLGPALPPFGTSGPPRAHLWNTGPLRPARPQRFILRTAYAALITIIAVVMPFFSSIAGLVGALTFYPLAIYFPFRMWQKVGWAGCCVGKAGPGPRAAGARVLLAALRAALSDVGSSKQQQSPPCLHCMQVFKPRGLFAGLLWAIDVSMLLVCAGATVGAVRDIINRWAGQQHVMRVPLCFM